MKYIIQTKLYTLLRTLLLIKTPGDTFGQGSLLGLTLTHMEVKNVRLCSES